MTAMAKAPAAGPPHLVFVPMTFFHRYCMQVDREGKKSLVGGCCVLCFGEVVSAAMPFEVYTYTMGKKREPGALLCLWRCLQAQNSRYESCIQLICLVLYVVVIKKF